MHILQKMLCITEKNIFCTIQCKSYQNAVSYFGINVETKITLKKNDLYRPAFTSEDKKLAQLEIKMSGKITNVKQAQQLFERTKVYQRDAIHENPALTTIQLRNLFEWLQYVSIYISYLLMHKA